MKLGLFTGKTRNSSKNLIATDTKASCGHSWNQFIDVQLIRAGNFLDLTLKVDPTGEKHNTTFSCFLTRSIKNFQQTSRVSGKPAPFTCKSKVMFKANQNNNQVKSAVLLLYQIDRLNMDNKS